MSDNQVLSADEPQAPDEATLAAPAADESAAPKRRASGAARFALFLSLLLLLLLIGGGGAGGWYLWQAYQARLAAESEQVQRLEASIADRVSRGELERAGQVPQQRIAGLQQALGQAQAQIEQQAEQIRHLTQRVNRNQRGWVLAEIEYLLRMADYRLRLAQDRNSAVAALQAADDALSRLGEVDLLPVRAALAEEIARLRRLPKPDPEGVALALAELQNSINRLPLAGATAAAAPEAAQAGEEGHLMALLQRFVVVKKNNRELAARPEPAAFATARRRLHTALELARLSALRLDMEVFNNSLSEAGRLLQAEFDLASDVGRSFRDSLQEQAARLHGGNSIEIGAARRLFEDYLAAQPAPAQGAN